MSSDEEDVLTVLAVLGLVQRSKRFRVRPYLQQRTYNIYQELQIEDRFGLKNFFRCTESDYEELLSLISQDIVKNTTWRDDVIQPDMRLGVTLRFLATGDSYTSLMYLLRISKQQLSKIIPEVCLAIYKRLKDVYLKDEPASSGDSGDESGSDPESPSEKLTQASLRQDWACSTAERDGGGREPQASTSSTTQEADSSKASQSSMPKILPKIDLPGGAMLYHPGVLAGLDGLGSNMGLGNLAMRYPHSFILGLANQGQEAASSSTQPQFITIPLSMAMGNPPANNGCPSASSDDSSELQDLSTGGRK